MSLALLLLLAADGGAVRADAGAVDAGTVARPFLVIAGSNDALAKVATAAPGERARLPGVVTTVQIGKTWSFGLFVDGYALPASRVVDLSVDVLITDSTGRQTLELANAARAKTMDPKTMVAVPLGPPLRLPFGLTDPEGVWTVRLKLFDGVRGTTTLTETSFTVRR